MDAFSQKLKREFTEITPGVWLEKRVPIEPIRPPKKSSIRIVGLPKAKR